MKAKFVSGDDLLIAYLDLCGTNFAYSKFPLEQQMERVEIVISTAFEELDTAFGNDQNSLYVHMFADTLVGAEKSRIDGCAEKFVQWLLQVQYQVLQNSAGLECIIEKAASKETRYMPILSRGLVKRGKYFGMLFDQFRTNIDEIFFNPSLVGGASIVEMDDALKGLPMGTYIDTSLVGESKIEPDRLLEVEGCGFRFVKPPGGFDFLRSQFSAGNPSNFDAWINQIIEAAGDNHDFKNKLKPWADAVQGRLHLIERIQNVCNKSSGQ